MAPSPLARRSPRLASRAVKPAAVVKTESFSTESSQNPGAGSKPAKAKRLPTANTSSNDSQPRSGRKTRARASEGINVESPRTQKVAEDTRSTTSLKRKPREDSGDKLAKQKCMAAESAEQDTSEGKLIATERKYWANGWKYVVGVDEAGRGPLAGPVVVAACSIDENAPDIESKLIDDSKIVDEDTRERVFEMLTRSKHVHYAVDIVTVEEIDTKNILRATLSGMDRVVEKLRSSGKCDVVLVDGPFAPPEAKANYGPSNLIEAIKGGDGKVRSIAAASILAKVTRDRIMREYHAQFPVYGFDRHKGYPVPAHVASLTKYGPCSIHRKSFAPVQRALQLLKTTKG